MSDSAIHQGSGSEHSSRSKGFNIKSESDNRKLKQTTSRPNKKKKLVVKRGRWQREESITFLKGLRLHGKGKWKEIAKSIPTRTTVQVKTHAQMILKKMDAGEDVFRILEDQIGVKKYPSIRNCKNEEATSSSTSRSTTSMSHEEDSSHGDEISSSTSYSSTSGSLTDSTSLPPLLDCLEVVTNINSSPRGQSHSTTTLTFAPMPTRTASPRTSLSLSSGEHLNPSILPLGANDLHQDNSSKNLKLHPNNNDLVCPDTSTRANDNDLQGAALLLLNFSSSPTRPDSRIHFNTLPPRLDYSISSSTLSSTGGCSDISSTTSAGNSNSIELPPVESNRFKFALDPVFTHEINFSLEANNCTAV